MQFTFKNRNLAIKSVKTGVINFKKLNSKFQLLTVTFVGFRYVKG